MIWRVALLVWLALAPLAGAQTLPGSADAAFRDALDLWLDDDEETALPAFAALAGQGNQAARLLLGLIDKKPPMQGPWLALQSRKARIGLLRAPGGLSGVSWLRRIDDVPLASRLLQVLDSDADIEAVLMLAADHEAVALRAGLAALEARQVTGFSAFADDPRFPPEMRYLIWRDWQKDPARAGRVDIALSERAAGDPQRTLIAGPVAAADLREWLLQTPLAAPLTSLCQAECPADPGRCMAAGFAALGGYRRFAATGTPLAALIPEDRFATSLRGRNSVLRQAVNYELLTETRLRQVEMSDICFAALLRQEGRRF